MSRISVGGAIAVAAYGAAINAVVELRDQGTTGYWDLPPWHARSWNDGLQSLTATVTSISTAPFRGRAATPMAERVWRPASPKTSARTLLAPSTTAGCWWKSGAEDTNPVTVRTRVDAVEGTERVLEHGEGVQRADGGRLGALLHRDGVAQSAEAGQLPGDAGQLPRRARHAVVHHHGVERVVGRVRPVQREAQLDEPGADGALATAPTACRASSWRRWR